MMMRIFDKISKIFFAFICFIVILGMVFLSIRNYITPIVSSVVVSPNGKIESKNYINGVISSDNNKVVEVKAARDMDISDVSIQADQIVVGGEKLFMLDISRSTTDKREKQDDINDKIYSDQLVLDKMIRALEKTANRQISNIDNFNSNDGISIYALADGKIKNLSISEGTKVTNNIISNIIDDSLLKISFKMSSAEFPNISVGQKMLVSFAGYEGYYEAEVISLNPNSVPDKDKISYLYNGVIHAKNPGLISPGVNVGVSTQRDGQAVATLTYAGLVESYIEQLPIKTDLNLISMDIYATKVLVVEGEAVKKGQKIAELGGDDLTSYFNEMAKNIKDMQKQINNLRKDINELYGDTITFNMESSLKMEDDGSCKISDKIYVEYITNNVSLREGETILRYRVYDSSSLQIKVTVDAKTYKSMPTVVYYGTDIWEMNTTTRLIKAKEFAKGYELSFEHDEKYYAGLSINDRVMLKFSIEDRFENIIPKSAIVPIGRIAVGSSGYVYIINKEESILGNVDVISEKRVTIKAVGDENVAIEFDKNFYNRGKDIVIVNFTDSTLKDGMRVRLK
jgi:hypothetical protein